MAEASRLKVLIIGYVWPEPTSSAAGFRDQNLIDMFREQGWDITLASPSKENSFTELFQNQGIQTFACEANDPRFDSFVSELKPDVVIYDRFVIEEQFGWRVREHSPQSLQVLDTQDLHCLRRARMKAVLEDGRDLETVFSAKLDLESSEDAYREIASIYRSDLTLLLSDFELSLLKSRFQIPDELLFWLGFTYQSAPASPGFEDRKNFALIGNFRHPPNWDGVQWFHQEIWPAIRKALPDTEVHLYGAYPPKEAMALTDPELGFIVKGWAPDQYETLRAYRVNLAPLRFGAGIKGKISDGWWSGCPVVTTPIGAEGMRSEDGSSFGGVIAQFPDEFAHAAVKLYQDVSHWEQARKNGLGILSSRFDFERNSQRFFDQLGECMKNLADRRKRNFTGGMLSHHFHRSTVYFSKWIEAKNKNPRT